MNEEGGTQQISRQFQEFDTCNFIYLFGLISYGRLG